MLKEVERKEVGVTALFGTGEASRLVDSRLGEGSAERGREL